VKKMKKIKTGKNQGKFTILKEKITDFRNIILRCFIFIILGFFSEFFLWHQISFHFQILYISIIISVWIFIVEITMGFKKFFKIHPKNYWSAFLIPLIVNILFNIMIMKYLNYNAVTGIVSTLLITMLIDFESGIVSSFIFSVFFTIMFGFDMQAFIILFLPSAFVAIFSKKIIRRIEIIIPFMISSLVQVFLMIIMNYRYFAEDLIILVGVNFFGTLISMGILPFFEYITRVYSDMGLLELGNLNHPLLKSLTLKAPGTYYHSMIIANISESAVEHIDGNPILARVGAYFHDIGKTWKPVFFTENQKNSNPHDNISPKLSSLILNNHVTYGIEKARKYRLPVLIEDMIEQHHGNRVKQFFYKKYYNETGIMDKDMFKYPGEIPQFKESAILMICDVTEAITRSMTDINPVSLNEKLDEQIQSLFFEGQLDDCGLTMKDIQKIKGKIIRTLLEMNHKRISYPKVSIQELKK